MLMGVTAVCGRIHCEQPDAKFTANSLVVWLFEAMLAFAIGLLAMWQNQRSAASHAVVGSGAEVAMKSPALDRWCRSRGPGRCGGFGDDPRNACDMHAAATVRRSSAVGHFRPASLPVMG